VLFEDHGVARRRRELAALPECRFALFFLSQKYRGSYRFGGAGAMTYEGLTAHSYRPIVHLYRTTRGGKLFNGL